MGVLVRRIVHAGLALAACAGAALASLPAAAQTAIRFTLDWRIEGPATPFLVAAERGYYKAENLEVRIDAGNGSLDPIARVASGSHDIGFGDINALIRHRDQNPNAPVKAIFVVYNKPPYAVISRKSRAIAQPKDLEGKRLGAPAADATAAQWPLFARINSIDVGKVTIENVGIPVREPMLAAGQVDAITGFSFSSFVNLKDRGVPVSDLVVMPMADYGLKLYGSAILVNTKFATERPEAVRAFLRAYMRGLRDTIRDPARAVDVVVARDEPLKKAVELERLRMAIRDNILTPEVRANGFGSVDPERLGDAIDQMEMVAKFKNKAIAINAFDGSFLPPLNERRAN